MGVLAGRPKWLVTISLHCDLLATMIQKHTQYGFLLWEPLLYNGGLRVLGCSPSGEDLDLLVILHRTLDIYSINNQPNAYLCPVAL
jgi:hypothetical protein